MHQQSWLLMHQQSWLLMHQQSQNFSMLFNFSAHCAAALWISDSLSIGKASQLPDPTLPTVLSAWNPAQSLFRALEEMGLESRSDTSPPLTIHISSRLTHQLKVANHM